MTPRHRSRTLAPRAPRHRAAAAVGLLAALSACGSDGTEAGAGASAADVRFATAMTQHHAQTLHLLNMPQTLEMPDEAVSWTDPARSERLGEIEDLTELLRRWKAKVPATGLDHASEGDHVEFDPSIDGVLTGEAVGDIRRTKGDAFAAAWFAALLDHERGALALARAQVDRGEDAAAVRFAEHDVERHSNLIATLERLAARS